MMPVTEEQWEGVLVLNGIIHSIEFHPAHTDFDNKDIAGSIRTWDGTKETHVVIYHHQLNPIIDWLTDLRGP